MKEDKKILLIKILFIVFILALLSVGTYHILIKDKNEDSQEKVLSFSYKNLTLIKDRTPYLIKDTYDSTEIYSRGKILYKDPFKTLSENGLKIVYCNNSLDREMIKYYEKEGNWERLKNSSLVKKC